MPRTCTICAHPERAAIETAVVAKTPFRNIAKKYGCSVTAVFRHATDHIRETVQHAQVAKDEAQSLNVVQQLKVINAITLAILSEARSSKQNGLALTAIDRVCKQLELQAKLLGDIDRPQVNILVMPEWQAIRATIVASLIPYPAARIAVAAALSQLEQSRDRLD